MDLHGASEGNWRDQFRFLGVLGDLAVKTISLFISSALICVICGLLVLATISGVQWHLKQRRNAFYGPDSGASAICSAQSRTSRPIISPEIRRDSRRPYRQRGPILY